MRWVDESSSGRSAPAPAPAGHVEPPDPPGGMLALRAWEVPDPYGGGVRALGYWLGASSPQGHVASPDPCQSGERVGGRCPGEVGA